MGGDTAAERICPWRRSSIPDEGRSASASPTNDPSSSPPVSSSANEPGTHSVPLTSASVSGLYHKSPEYMGDYATTTKPEERLPRTNIRDLFNHPSRAPDERQENDLENDRDESETRL